MKKIDSFVSLFLIVSIVFIFFITCRALYFGAFAFWFDPARDLGLGLANLRKLSLIGHPSGGLPGLFYGPYYIWLISFAEIFSKDPRWIWFAVATVPYFTLFPLVMLLYRKYTDISVILAFILLFLLSFTNHSQIWNPNPTPIMYLGAVYFATLILFKNKQIALYAILTGLLAGFIANFHMSFGIGIIVSFGLLFLVNIFKAKTADDRKHDLTNRIVVLFLFFVGVGTTYFPFLLFEFRHGFNQIKIILTNFYIGLTQGTSLNLGHGFSRFEIVDYFFVQGSKLLHIPLPYLFFFIAFCFVYILFQARRTKKRSILENERNLLSIVLINAGTVLFLFLTAKNPVYDYFYIGVEMFFLLVALIITRKIPVVKWSFITLAFVLLALRVGEEVRALGVKNISSNYASKRKVVELIYKDVVKPPFTVYVYDPAIYTFDYDYLFEMFQDTYGFKPNRQDSSDKNVYIILPESKNQGSLRSFTEYHTPPSNFITKKKWVMDDRTVILKRERIP